MIQIIIPPFPLFFTTNIQQFLQLNMSKQHCRTFIHINSLMQEAGSRTLLCQLNEAYSTAQIDELKASYKNCHDRMKYWTQKQSKLCHQCSTVLMNGQKLKKVMGSLQNKMKVEYLFKSNKDNFKLMKVRNQFFEELKELAQHIHEQQLCQDQASALSSMLFDERHRELSKLLYKRKKPEKQQHVGYEGQDYDSQLQLIDKQNTKIKNNTTIKEKEKPAAVKKQENPATVKKEENPATVKKEENPATVKKEEAQE